MHVIALNVQKIFSLSCILGGGGDVEDVTREVGGAGTPSILLSSIVARVV